MVTMAVVERNDEQQKSGSLGVKDGVSLSSTKEIADPVVYKLVRVDGDGRIVPATDDELMEVDDLLLEEDKSELPLVADTGCILKDDLLPVKNKPLLLEEDKSELPLVADTGCILKDELLLARNKLLGSEGISTNAELKVQKLKTPMEETVPLVSHGANDKCSTQVGVEMCLKPARFLKLSGSSSLASATCSSSTPDFSKIKGEDGVNDKCSTQVGIEMCLKPAGFLKLSGSSSLASATCSIPKPDFLSSSATCISSMPDFSKMGVEMCLKPAGFLKLSGSSSLASATCISSIPDFLSSSATCSSSMPDFSKIEGEVCLDNLSVKELHETFRATFGRETTVKDKLWLKRRIAMGLTNSCDVATSTFIIKDKTLIRRKKIEGGAPCEIKCSKSEDQIDGIFKGSRKDSPVTLINQVGDEQVSGKRLRKSDAEDEYICEDPHNEHTKRVRKPTKRYIEELSEVDNSESSGKPVPSVKSSGNCHSDPKPWVRPVQNVRLDRPVVVVTRQESFGGSGVQVPYVSRVRRGRPRENCMPLMKFHPGSMGVDAKPVTKTLDVCVSQPDSENGDKDLKAKLAPQQSEQPKDEEDTEDKENRNEAKTCISVEQQVETKNLDLARNNSDHNVKTQSTTKGEPIRKHHRAWTLNEVTQLVEGVSRYGAGRWSEIKRLGFSACSYRTSVDLKDKWRNLLRASYAHSPAVRDMTNSKKQAAMPLPAHILLRVRELAEKYSQVPPPDLCRKVGGGRGGGLSRKIASHKVGGGVSAGSSVGRPIVNETRSGFL